MKVTLLYFNDCPNWIVTNDHLQALAPEFPDLDLERVPVETPEAAERTSFRGSPSVIVNGVDVFADADAPVGLSCRMYQTPGGVAGSPTIDQLREVLARGRT